MSGTGAPHLHVEEHAGSWSNPIDCTGDVVEVLAARRFPGQAVPAEPSPPVAPSPSPIPATNGVHNMAGKFFRQSDPNRDEYQTIAYCGVAPSIGPDILQQPARFVGGLYVIKFGGPVALSCVLPDDEPVHDATPDQWAFLNTLPLVYQAA
jgi:hypothetical protein